MDQWGRKGWSKWANTLFKRDKPLGSEAWFNPEAVTEQKREWIEQQQKTQGVQEKAWPEHIYENFFIVGLPPDMELTQVAEQLCDLERKKRSDSDNDTETTKEHLQPPQPSFTPQVLLRAPPGAPAPISDDEVAAFCFPSGVAPEKLKRTPSLSALDELVMGRDSDQQQQCFVFMLKVGGNFPLYGCCWYVREMLHRPPYLARQEFRNCRAPFRQCMIAAPRCYCLLSHYPFFDLHFRVLKIVLDLERLERLLEYDSEKSKLRPPGPNLLSPSSPMAHAAPAAGGRRSLPDTFSGGGAPSGPNSQPGSLSSSLANSRAQSPAFGSSSRPSRSSAAGAGGHAHGGGSAGGAAGAAVAAAAAAAGAAPDRQPTAGLSQAAAVPPRRQTPDGDVQMMQAHVVHNRQLYCAECAGIIEDMCPFTPGAGGVAASAPSWSQWQQQKHRGSSPLGPDGSGDKGSGQPQQQQQQQPQQQQEQESGGRGNSLQPSPFEGEQPGVPSDRCEVCGKRLRMSTPDGVLLQDSSSASDAAAAGASHSTLAAAGGSNSRSSSQAQTSLIGTVAGVLPASIAAALQSVHSGSSHGAAASQSGVAAASQQQQQQFDAVAAAAAEFDAAGGRSSSGAQTSDHWAKWQGVVCAVRGANSTQQLQQPQQQLSHGGGGSTNSLLDSLSTSVPETSMVQRMWETWAPKALEGSSSAEAGHTGGSARLSGGLSLFKRASRASSTLADQLQQHQHQQQQQATLHSSRGSWPAPDLAGTAAGGVGEAQEQQQQPQQQLLQGNGTVQQLSVQHGEHLQQQGGDLPQQQQQQQELLHAGASVQQLQHAGTSIPQQPQHYLSIPQSGPGHGIHGPSRLRPDPGQATPEQHSQQGPAAVVAAAPAAAAGAGGEDGVALWQSDPNMRSLRSYPLGSSRDTGLAVFPAGGPEGLRDISTTSNASFYSVEDVPVASTAAVADLQTGKQSLEQQGDEQQGDRQQQQWQQEHGMGQSQSSSAVQQMQQLQQQQRGAVLCRRGTSEVLLRSTSPSGRQQQQQLLPTVQLNGRRQQRWSDPASWPSRPRTTSPLPMLSSGGRAPHSSRAAGGTSTSGDCIVSAFAAIAAAAEPFECAAPRVSMLPSTSSSLNAGCELLASSSTGSELEAAAAAVVSATGDGTAAAAWDTGSQGAAASVNVTIGGGVIPSAGDSKLQVQLQPLAMQPPSRTGSGRRSALFEEVALRRSGDMSSELRTTISHLVQVDSSTLLAAYYASPIPQPGETYRLLLGDLYRLEFERCLPLQEYAPPGRSRLRQELLTYAEVECAQHLQLWTVAALCRSLSLDNIISLVNAALLEKQLVVFCPHIGTLGSVVLALVPLLRPFTWQSLVMPVTPVNMLGFLDAPVPFVLGVQYKTPDVASRCHGLMRVNVYKDAVKNASFPSMPNTRQLSAALAPFHTSLREAAELAVERPVHVITPDEEEAARRFLGVMHDYLSKLCGDLRLHTIVNVGMSKRTGVFMKESLLESLPMKDRAFMRAFMDTQMFAAYCDGVISDYCEA